MIAALASLVFGVLRWPWWAPALLTIPLDAFGLVHVCSWRAEAGLRRCDLSYLAAHMLGALAAAYALYWIGRGLRRGYDRLRTRA